MCAEDMAFLDNMAVYAAVPALIWSSTVYLVQSIGIIMLYVLPCASSGAHSSSTVQTT